MAINFSENNTHTVKVDEVSNFIVSLAQIGNEIFY